MVLGGPAGAVLELRVWSGVESQGWQTTRVRRMSPGAPAGRKDGGVSTGLGSGTGAGGDREGVTGPGPPGKGWLEEAWKAFPAPGYRDLADLEGTREKGRQHCAGRAEGGRGEGLAEEPFQQFLEMSFTYPTCQEYSSVYSRVVKPPWRCI